MEEGKKSKWKREGKKEEKGRGGVYHEVILCFPLKFRSIIIL